MRGTREPRVTRGSARRAVIRDFEEHLGRTPDLRRPTTFNEKIQWLKLHYHHDLLTACADKLRMRDFVRERCGEGFTVPLITEFDDPLDIAVADLPEAFVLKVNNGSGDNVVVRRGDSPTDEELQRKATSWVQGTRSHWMKHYEWAYKDISPRVFAEELIDTPALPTDYKVWCFGGRVHAVLVVRDRGSDVGLTRDFMTPEWEPMENVRAGSGTIAPDRPALLDELLDVSRRVSEPFPFVRVDCYLEGGRVVIGELTFYPSAGLEPFADPRWDAEFGAALPLPDPLPQRWRD